MNALISDAMVWQIFLPPNFFYDSYCSVEIHVVFTRFWKKILARFFLISKNLWKHRIFIWQNVFTNQYVELTKLSEMNCFISNEQGKAQTVRCKLYTSAYLRYYIMVLCIRIKLSKMYLQIVTRYVLFFLSVNPQICSINLLM